MDNFGIYLQLPQGGLVRGDDKRSSKLIFFRFYSSENWKKCGKMMGLEDFQHFPFERTSLWTRVGSIFVNFWAGEGMKGPWCRKKTRSCKDKLWAWRKGRLTKQDLEPESQPFFNGCLVISNHFLCKDLVHHPIETTNYKWMFQVPEKTKTQIQTKVRAERLSWFFLSTALRNKI